MDRPVVAATAAMRPYYPDWNLSNQKLFCIISV